MDPTHVIYIGIGSVIVLGILLAFISHGVIRGGSGRLPISISKVLLVINSILIVLIIAGIIVFALVFDFKFADLAGPGAKRW